MTKKRKYFYEKITGILLLTVMLAMTGCAGQSKNVAETIISLAKNGTVQSYISETFEQSYYDKEELQQMILSEAASYNREMGEAHISVDKVEVEDGMAVVQMGYTSAADYGKFNQVIFFAGTPEEARQEGYDLNVVLSSVKNPQETLGQADILSADGALLLITDSSERIGVYGKVLYASDNATVADNLKSFQRQPDSDKMAYIIIKK